MVGKDYIVHKNVTNNSGGLPILYIQYMCKVELSLILSDFVSFAELNGLTSSI